MRRTGRRTAPYRTQIHMPHYANFAQFISDLASNGLGRLWLSKFQFDVDNGNLSGDDRSEFETFVEANLNDVAPLTTPLAALEFVLSRNSSLDLRSHRPSPALTKFTCFVRLEVYFYYLLDRHAFASIIDEAEDDMDFVWENLGGLISSAFHAGQLRTERRFFWCATADEIEVIGTGLSIDDHTTLIRDRLGLSHMSRGQRIVRLSIPPHVLTGLTIRPPTTLDGGINPAFVPAAEPDCYGRTLNLRSHRRDLKELVVQEVPFTAQIEADKQGTIKELCPPLDLKLIDELLR